MLSIVRNRRVVAAVTAGLASRPLGAGFLLFAFFYVVAYVMTWPPVVDAFLSLARSGSSDLLTYARYAKHLLIFGSPDLDAAGFEYLRSPSVPYLLAGFSSMFNHDPLSAAMPAQFVLVALTGVAIAGVCRSTFSLPLRAAVVIATILITSPYFRQVASAYRLPELITVTVFLFLFWLTARTRGNRAIDGSLTVLLTTAYVVLLFTDAPALFAALGLQAAVIAVIGSLAAECARDCAVVRDFCTDRGVGVLRPRSMVIPASGLVHGSYEHDVDARHRAARGRRAHCRSRRPAEAGGANAARSTPCGCRRCLCGHRACRRKCRRPCCQGARSFTHAGGMAGYRAAQTPAAG